MRWNAQRLGLVLCLSGFVGGHQWLSTSDPQSEASTRAEGLLVVLPPATSTGPESRSEATAGQPENLAATLADYLNVIAEVEVGSTTLREPKFDVLLEQAADARAALVFVVGADSLLPELVDDDRMRRLGEWGFVLETVDAGDWENALGSRGATFVLIAGNSALSRQYAIYELLRRFGVRFFHPEQEHVPVHAAHDLRALAAHPTVLHRDGNDYVPDFAWRSWSFHSAHPLEHLEAFSDGDHPIEEARNVAEWIVKNRGNRFRGAARGLASPDARQRRSDELAALSRTLGFPRGAGITLHNEQQGATAEVDAAGENARAQIEKLIEEKLAAVPDARWLTIHFGPTEFTTTPDRQTVQWLDWAAHKALELRPDLEVEINNHITGAQPTTAFSDLGCPTGTNDAQRSDYYDLAFHTDRRSGVSVHTVMFYALEGAANVYNQKSFAHKLCLMQRASHEGRPLVYFPEGSWWLSFDNSVPIYLPLYMWSRGRDIELLRPLLARNGGTLRGHRMFNSGQEWGYWQQDYAVGLWSWNADVPLAAVLGEIFDPLCEPSMWREGCVARTRAVEVVQDVIAHQREFFLERSDWRGRSGGLVAYFAGEDEADRIAARSGYEFRPVRVAFGQVLRWNETQLEHFERTDLDALDDAAAHYERAAERLLAVRGQVPEAGLPWLDEVVDGLTIDNLRARHSAAVYRAVVHLRRAALTGRTESHEAKAQLDIAAVALQAAEKVVARREAAYRYPVEQLIGGGVTSKTAKQNGTTYPFRLHTKTHLLSYWHNRQREAERLLDPDAAGSLVDLGDAIASRGRASEVAWAVGARGNIEVGRLSIDENEPLLSMGGAAGTWPVSGVARRGDVVAELTGTWVRADALAHTPASGITLVRPEHPAAQTVLATVFPSLEWAWLPRKRTLVFAPDADHDFQVGTEDVVVARTSRVGGKLQTEPMSFALPIATTAGGQQLSMRVSHAVATLSVRDGALGSDATIVGELVLEDIVVGLIELAGYERLGAYRTLSRMLDFDAASPPATIPFEAKLRLETQEP